MNAIRERFERLAKSASDDLSPEGLVCAGIGMILLEMEKNSNDLIRARDIFAKGKNDFVMSADIRAFQEKYHQTYSGPPRSLPDSLLWRVKHMQEELDKEYVHAVAAKDITDQADALTDLLFLTLGTMYMCGFPIAACWNEVFRSNMTKEYVEGKGKFGAGVHKGENYSAPQLELVLFPKA